jgi:hypothetical protein
MAGTTPSAATPAQAVPGSAKERGRAITEDAEREELEEAQAPGAESGLLVDPAPAQEAPSPFGIASFKIVLGHAYYDKGYINPGVEASSRQGDEGDPIEVAFDDGTASVISRIDRRANPNGSVRIVGRNPAIPRWFQNRFRKGDVVKALVMNSHRVLLLSRPRSASEN